jgi:thioredoxin reductase (NADPH)
MRDVIIVGAGPIGLASGIAAKRRDLDALILEKGALVNSLVNYPTDLEFFSTPDLLEIGGHPFPCRGVKPVRAEAVEYYSKVADREGLNIRLYEEVQRVSGEDEQFTVHTGENAYEARKVVVATGFFDVPNRLEVPGEELSNVRHYYKEPYPYTRQKVIVIGARNSAAKVALDCYRHGADVTLVHRGEGISDHVKYWIKPDLENRIEEGEIETYFRSTVEAITEDTVHLDTPEGPTVVKNDWVLAMTGYRPDLDFLERLGIRLRDNAHRTPVFDDETMETNRRGVYLAGVVCGGLKTSDLFIENSRIHARRIMTHIHQKAGMPA